METFGYDDAGRVQTIHINEGSASPGVTGPIFIEDLVITVTPPSGAGTLRSTINYNKIGQITHQLDISEMASGGNPAVQRSYQRDVTYNTKGQIATENTFTIRDLDTWRNNSTFTYGTGSSYYLGAATSVTTSTQKNLFAWTYAATTNSYIWRDAAVQSYISYDSDTTSGSNAVHTTNFTRDASGALNSSYINDGRNRTVTFVNDHAGQVVARTEADSLSGGDPKDIYYRFGGREMGRVSNNGDSNMNFSASAEDRTRTPITGAGAGAFKHGWTSGATSVDFDQNYNAINSYNSGSTAGGYTVRAGDTLQGIAANLYGDSALWYKIASANGLSGASNLTEGTTLRLPAGVQQNTYTAKTFKPYNPAEAIGDLSPTTPEPPKDAKCGVFGQILLAVVAVAVTVVTGGNAVLGNLASQAVGLITGIQDKFSFKSLGMAWLTGGVSGGVNAALGGVATSTGGAIVRGVVSSTISQGIGVATGLQDKFSWSGVAAAGIGAGVGFKVGQSISGSAKFGTVNGVNVIDQAATNTNQIISSSASAIANAATRSAIDGSNFGDNIIASIPDVIGQAVGGAIGGYAGQNGFLDKLGPIGDIINFANDVTNVSYSAFETVGQQAAREIKGAFAAPAPNVESRANRIEKSFAGLSPVGGMRRRAELYSELPGAEYYEMSFVAEQVDDQIIVQGQKRKGFWNTVGGSLGFGTGVVVGFAQDTLEGVASLADFVILDMGGTVLYGADQAINFVLPNKWEYQSAYTQSYVDYVNAVTVAEDLTVRAFTDPEALWGDIKAGFSTASANSNAQDSAFMRGKTNPGWKVATGAFTLAFAPTKSKLVADASKLGKLDDVAKGSVLASRLTSINSKIIRFSQKTIKNETSDGIPLETLINDMKTNGFNSKYPINVVKQRDGTLTSLDNRRLFAAQEANRKVFAIVRRTDEFLPEEYAARLARPKLGQFPKTFGEAIKFRIHNQGGGFRNQNPLGSFNAPRISVGN